LTINTKTTDIIYRKISDVSATAVTFSNWRLSARSRWRDGNIWSAPNLISICC